MLYELPKYFNFSEYVHVFEKYTKNETVNGICFIFQLADDKLVLFKLRHIAGSNRLYGSDIVVKKHEQIEISNNSSSIKFSDILKAIVIPQERWEVIRSEFELCQKEIDSMATNMKGYEGKSGNRRYFYSRYNAILITVKPNGIDYDISHGTSKAKTFVAYYKQENEEYFLTPRETYGNWLYCTGVMYKGADWFEISPDNYSILSAEIARKKRRIFEKIHSLFYWNTIFG